MPTLSELFPDSPLKQPNLKISDLAFDSRLVREGAAFFCLPGETHNGHDFVAQALCHGAQVIVASAEQRDRIDRLLAENAKNSTEAIFVDDVRQTLAIAADRFYGRPSRMLKLCGVTGTNGKTTVTHLIGQLLRERVGVLGTLGNKIFAGGRESNFLGGGSGRTTPEAPELQAALAHMWDDGCRHVCMEVSSHALAQKRVYACNFEAAVFTNLTQDHLDYHLTMENYFAAKAKLFQSLAKGSVAVLNADDPWYARFRELLPAEVKTVTYGINSAAAQLQLRDISLGTNGSKATLSTPWGEGRLMLSMPGRFNLYNALGALAVALHLGVSLTQCLERAPELKAVSGRFEVIEKPQADLPTCIVDYAHTPDGLEKVLHAAHSLLPSDGKLLCVFGCGGDRDLTKRPMMGRIAEHYAQTVIVTSDNPRTEDPTQIVADIMAGVEDPRRTYVQLDREHAIRQAIRMAGSSDVVVIAGKGHESYQIIGQETRQFDDREQVRRVYAELS